MHRSALETILSPHSKRAFLDNYFGKSLLYVPGKPNKFAELLPWPALNNILRHHALSVPRIRLVKEGKGVPTELFMKNILSRDMPLRTGIWAREVTAQLQQGATLIINGIDEMYEAITVLAEGLERDLQTRIGTNMYAAWRATQGFDLHWDDHDVFVLQVAGRKQWQIHGETVRFPLDHRATNPHLEPPKSGPVWEGCMKPGDLLYIPRGWWHLAIPCDEPTIHLTVGTHNPTALDLMQWLTRGLGGEECMRMDLPRFASREIQDQHMETIRSTITKALLNPDLLSAYFHHSSIMSDVRPVFGLPWSAIPDVLPGSDEFVISVIPRYVDVQNMNGALDVSFNGQTVTFKGDVAPLLTRVLQNSPFTIREFYEQCADTTDRSAASTFLADMVRTGMAVLREPNTA